MKILGPVVLLLVLLGGGYWAYTHVLGGSVSGTAPTKGLPTSVPDLPDPADAANKGAESAEKGANGLADGIAHLSPAAWRMISLLIVAGFIVWLLMNPKRRAFAFGLAAIVLLVMLIK